MERIYRKANCIEGPSREERGEIRGIVASQIFDCWWCVEGPPPGVKMGKHTIKDHWTRRDDCSVKSTNSQFLVKDSSQEHIIFAVFGDVIPRDCKTGELCSEEKKVN